MTAQPLIDHGPKCSGTRPPTLRASWTGAPELACPECGRYAPAPDTRPTERNHR